MGSLAWAKEDGIRIDERGWYYPHCEICDVEIRKTEYSRVRTYICDDCKKLIKELKDKKKRDKEEKLLAEGEKRFKQALKKLAKQGIDETWDRAIEIAETRKEAYGSIPEVIMAIGLIRTKHKIIPQQKVGSLTVDFALPDQKRVVEVDGGIYHIQYSKEEERDLRMISMLGKGWDIVHVPAEMVEDNVLYAIAFFVDKEKPTTAHG